jgi:anti-sigma regulatory factor (Ser/Thr protein kinase)
MSSPALVQDNLARLQWGDHVCHLFDQKEDLGQILVPYFKAGLERNEACLWVTSSPYATERAASDMRAAMPDFDRRTAAGQIQIIGYDEWYTKQGALSAAETIRNWVLRKDEALASGYAGLRITGNTSFLDEGMWNDFMDYERALDVALQGQRILTLCSYCKAKCSVDAMLEAMCAHGLSLTKHHDHWNLLNLRGRRYALRTPEDQLDAAYRIELRDIVEVHLAEFIAADQERVTLEGSHVELSRQQATRLALIVQELVANAMRHGALSAPKGKVAVRWRLSINGARRLQITWTESGTPILFVPEKLGFGTRLIAHLAENYERVFEPEGMTCRFEVDLSNA